MSPSLSSDFMISNKFLFFCDDGLKLQFSLIFYKSLYSDSAKIKSWKLDLFTGWFSFNDYFGQDWDWDRSFGKWVG